MTFDHLNDAAVAYAAATGEPDPRAAGADVLAAAAEHSTGAVLAAARQVLIPRAGDRSIGQSRFARRRVCEAVPLILAAHQAGELGAADEERLQRHLAECPACAGLAETVERAEQAFSATLAEGVQAPRALTIVPPPARSDELQPTVPMEALDSEPGPRLTEPYRPGMAAAPAESNPHGWQAGRTGESVVAVNFAGGDMEDPLGSPASAEHTVWSAVGREPDASVPLESIPTAVPYALPKRGLKRYTANPQRAALPVALLLGLVGTAVAAGIASDRGEQRTPVRAAPVVASAPAVSTEAESLAEEADRKIDEAAAAEEKANRAARAKQQRDRARARRAALRKLLAKRRSAARRRAPAVRRVSAPVQRRRVVAAPRRNAVARPAPQRQAQPKQVTQQPQKAPSTNRPASGPQPSQPSSQPGRQPPPSS